MAAAVWFVNALAAYAAIGLLFAAAFLTAGISRVDPASKGSGIGFRLIILPGVAALWPLMLKRWVLKRWIQGKGRAI
jgi:hypothetical protein